MAVPRMSNLIASRNWSQALTASRQSSNKDDRSPKVDVKDPSTSKIFHHGSLAKIFQKNEYVTPEQILSDQEPGSPWISKKK